MRISAAFIFWATVSVAHATPDHAVEEQERYLGSTETAYAVVRVKLDNLGSHYSDRRTTYLDEYNKSDGELMKSRILLDVKHHRDVEHNDPNTRPKVEKEILEKNDSLIWADILDQYNVDLAADGARPYWSDRLRWGHGGVYFGESKLILWGGTLEKKYGLKMEPEFESSGELSPDQLGGEIREVTYAQEWLYLQLALKNQDDDSGRRIKIVPIPPETTRKIFAWAEMKETYLRMGRYESREEANAAAWAVIADCRERKIYGVNFEIWEVKPPTDVVEYIVVDAYSESTIRNNKVEGLEGKIGSKLVPISNRGFVQKWKPMAPFAPGDVKADLLDDPPVEE